MNIPKIFRPFFAQVNNTVDDKIYQHRAEILEEQLFNIIQFSDQIIVNNLKPDKEIKSEWRRIRNLARLALKETFI